ncbi:hypothetical protein GBF38_017302, partial [Nibea albiflora]
APGTGILAPPAAQPQQRQQQTAVGTSGTEILAGTTCCQRQQPQQVTAAGAPGTGMPALSAAHLQQQQQTAVGMSGIGMPAPPTCLPAAITTGHHGRSNWHRDASATCSNHSS